MNNIKRYKKKYVEEEEEKQGSFGHYKTKWLIAVRKRGVVGKNPAFVVNHPKSFNHSSVFKQKLILIPLNGIYRGGDVAGLRSIVDKIIY